MRSRFPVGADPYRALCPYPLTMAETELMWFRRDLRVRDLPALHAAARAERTVPVFVFDERLYRTGRFPSPPRTAFMLGCLRELDAALRERGGRLVVRTGRPEAEIPKLARETGAERRPLDADASPWALAARDQRVIDALAGLRCARIPHPGACVVDDPSRSARSRASRTRSSPPFARTWLTTRRAAPGADAARADAALDGAQPAACRARATSGPSLDAELAFAPGEAAGRAALALVPAHPAGGLRGRSRHARRRLLAPVPLPALGLRLAAGARHEGRRAPRHRLAELPQRAGLARLLRGRAHALPQASATSSRSATGLDWDRPGEQLEAWKQGRTGYPLVDAGMRQLAARALDAQPRADGRRLVLDQGPAAWTGGSARRHFMALPGSTATWPPTTAAGSGSPPRAPTPRRTSSASSTRSPSSAATTPTAPTCAAGCPSLRDVPDAHLAEPWADERRGAARRPAA